MRIFKKAQGVRIALCRSEISIFRALHILNMRHILDLLSSNHMGSDLFKKVKHIPVAQRTAKLQPIKVLQIIGVI